MGAFNYAPLFIMDEKKSENINKTPEKMSRIAWPKAKYGLIVAIIIIVVVNLIYYKDKIINLFG